MTDTMLDGGRQISRRVALGFAGLSIVGATSYGLFRSLSKAPAGFGGVNDYAFILTEQGSKVTLVDLANEEVAGTVTFPAVPNAFEVSRDLERVYATNLEARKLYELDLQTQTVVNALDLPLEPRTTLLSPDGLTLAIADGEHRLAIVDLAETRVRGVVEGLARPDNLAFSNDSFHIFVPNNETGRIDIVDAMSAMQLDPIQLTIGQGGKLSAVTRTPNGLYGLVVDQASGKVAIINFRNWEEMRVMDVGPGASRPYGTSDGRYMMIANDAARTLTIISTEVFDIEAILPSPGNVTSITTGFFETLAFITSSTEKKTSIIDLEKMELAGEIDYHGSPGPALVDSDGSRMYVPIKETSELAIIDVHGKSISNIINILSENPKRVALAATNNYCH